VFFKQFYVGCLAHASYLIGDGGEAAVVDPSRDVDGYIAEAAAQGLKIRWVLETHLHADFVSGHRELASRTGATIAIGEKAEAAFPHRPLREGDDLRVGKARIRVLETPGHTPESVSYVVYETLNDEKPWAVLTGDTLFVGDVGRVDILSSRLPVIELAGMMYDSLHGKLLHLPDDTRVYPAHGAGSLCGRNISNETWSTIGRERDTNAALRPMSRDAFIADVTRDVPETPVYYLHSRDLNQAGPSVREHRAMPPSVAAADAARRVESGAVLLDVRTSAAYGACHPANALHVALDGQYASWVGTLLRPNQPLVMLVEPDRAEEAVTRLARVGYENVEAVLEGGIDGWVEARLPVRTIAQVPVTDALAGRSVLDVRRPREWDAFHLPGATHVPLAQLPSRLSELDPGREWTVVCAGGYRSAIATSVLERGGFARVVNGVGGMDAWRKAQEAVESR
jgi:glyoxylase-like metal-dependent hydrolase (beta-lactamase superfamily II)/rhodanese-related sulfurtransferase